MTETRARKPRGHAKLEGERRQHSSTAGEFKIDRSSIFREIITPAL
jgi:hypothetical protein